MEPSGAEGLQSVLKPAEKIIRHRRLPQSLSSLKMSVRPLSSPRPYKPVAVLGENFPRSEHKFVLITTA